MDTGIVATENISGKDHTFKVINRGQMRQLANVLHQQRVEQAPSLVTTLTTKGLKPEQYPMVLSELTREPSYPEVIRWLYTISGTTHALALSADVDVDEVESWPERDEHQDIALKACGMDIGEVVASGDIPKSQTSTETTETT